LVIVTALGLAWCAIERTHVSVDILMMHMPRTFQKVMENAFMLVIFILFGIITATTLREALEADQVSSLLRIPLNPFYWLFVVGLAMLTIASLAVFIENITGVVKK